jgi:hypothetical protein
MTTGPIDPIETALLVARHFDALGIAHAIGGSIASSFAGGIGVGSNYATDSFEIQYCNVRN